MFTKRVSPAVCDLLALIGFVSVVAGVYLWLGLAAALILNGVAFIYVSIQLPEKEGKHELDQANHTER